MTERDILESYQPGDVHYEKAQYALETGLSLLDFDEWCFISDVLEREILFHDVHLMNKYVLEYNAAYHTDYDWDWIAYPEDTDTQELFEHMLAFAHAQEEGGKS